jgi:hypothetical protein
MPTVFNSSIFNPLLLNTNLENLRRLNRSSECDRRFLLSASIDKRCCHLLFLVLTQHDEIRNELIIQKGDSLFLRCALEKKFNSLKAKPPALEILLAMASDNECFASLKANVDFMKYIETSSLPSQQSAQVSTASSEESLQRISSTLLWKLRELDLSAEQINGNQASTDSPTARPDKKYDVMLSYSHRDKELCHRIMMVQHIDPLLMLSKTLSSYSFACRTITNRVQCVKRKQTTQRTDTAISSHY